MPEMMILKHCFAILHNVSSFVADVLMLMICFVCYIVLPCGATHTLNVILKKSNVLLLDLFTVSGAERNRFDDKVQNSIFM